MKGFNKGDVQIILEVGDPGRTRIYGYRLDEVRFRKEIRRRWFSNRVVNDCNRLSGHVVEASATESFKDRRVRLYIILYNTQRYASGVYHIIQYASLCKRRILYNT